MRRSSGRRAASPDSAAPAAGTTSAAHAAASAAASAASESEHSSSSSRASTPTNAATPAAVGGDTVMKSESSNGGASHALSDAEAAHAAAASSLSSMPSATTALLQGAAIKLPASTVMQQHGVAGVTPPTGMSRFSTMPQHLSSGMVAAAPGTPMPSLNGYVAPSGAPVPFTRQVSRLPAGGAGSTLGLSSEWRAGVSVEERIGIRRKLREAYFRHCPSYEALLETVTAVDEELLFACSQSRLDYFKSGIDWDGKIQIKRQQLKGSAQATAAAAAEGGTAAAASAMGGKKRSLDGSNLSASSTSVLGEIGINNSDLLPPGQPMSAAAAGLPPMSSLSVPSMAALRSMAPPFPIAADATASPNKKQRI